MFIKENTDKIRFLIVGSQAMNIHLPHNKKVKAKDLDVFVSDFEEGLELGDLFIAFNTDKAEIHSLPRDIFDQLVRDVRYYHRDYTEVGYASLETLYALKLSHAEYNIHWNKTVSHIQLMKRELRNRTPGFTFDSLSHEHKTLFKDLKDYWSVTHGAGKKRIRLDVTKQNFFNPNVARIYDHDFLHECVAYYDEPLHRQVLRNGHSVLLDESKFNALSFNDKIKLAKEEIYVIALERFLIPKGLKSCPVQAYQLALRKVVLQLSKGWFPTFIIDNYDKMYKMDIDYVSKFVEASGYDR